MKKTTKHPVIGLFVALLGAYFMAVGAGLVEADGVHVPLWVLFFVGLLFFIAGLLVFSGKTLPNKSYVAALMLLCFSMVGFGIGFFQDSSTAEKWIFGTSSTICMLLSLLALKDHRKQGRNK